MLGWFIEHRPSRVMNLFGAIIGRAEQDLDIPREVTTRSLRSSICLDGRYDEKINWLDEFLERRRAAEAPIARFCGSVRQGEVLFAS